MSKRVVIPPLKSQGIKTKLVPWILDHTPPINGSWIEPFVGTGVVAFNARQPKTILGDANPHIIQFYKDIQKKILHSGAVRDYLHREGALLSHSTDKGKAHYMIIRERFNQSFSPFDFLFLSRTGFNGMMRFNKKGLWNIPFCKKPDRFSAGYITKICNQVETVSDIIKPEPQWCFHHASFDKIIPMAGEDDFIYCDPPYFGRHADYYNGWTEADEERLFTLLCETKARFMLSTWHHNSYRINDMIARYWSKFTILTKDHFYHNGATIDNRRPMVEALVCNFTPSERPFS